MSEPVPKAEIKALHQQITLTAAGDIDLLPFRSPRLADAVRGYPCDYPRLGTGRQEERGEQEDEEERAKLHARWLILSTVGVVR